MSVEIIEKNFKEKVSEKVRVVSEGLNRYRVFTPFLFEDGDHLAITLRHNQSKWTLSDEGHTFMHMTYDIDEKDLRSGTRQKVISNALSMFSVQDNDGELILPVCDDKFGDSLYSFVQALLKVTDVSYLSRERVKSTFNEDFRGLLVGCVAEDRRIFSWSDKQHDPQGLYNVDCRINKMAKPLFIFALSNDDKTRDATIAIQKFENWGIPFRTMAIFEDQEAINRKVLARFSDVCEKQYSNIGSNQERIGKYLSELVSANN